MTGLAVNPLDMLLQCGWSFTEDWRADDGTDGPLTSDGDRLNQDTIPAWVSDAPGNPKPGQNLFKLSFWMDPLKVIGQWVILWTATDEPMDPFAIWVPLRLSMMRWTSW